MTVEPQELGLRERKRIATSRAIQVAAVELIAEQGLGATVEEISRRANVSPRTFFNYFPSKEDAVLGGGPPVPSGQLVDDFVSAGSRGESLLDGIATMIIASVDESEGDVEFHKRRRAVVKAHPEFAAQRMATTRIFEEGLAEIVTKRLLADDPALEGATARRQARVVSMAAFGVMRHAWIMWADESVAVSLRTQVRSAFDELKALIVQKSLA